MPPITIPTIYAAYASVQDYRTAIGKGSPEDDITLADQLVATSRFWDKVLRRPSGFRIDETATTRVYYVQRGPDGCGSNMLFVQDIGDDEGVIIKIDTDGDRSFADETAIDAGDYELWPPNALTGPDPHPYDCVVYRGGGGWPLDTAIQVTAKHGWPATPGRPNEVPALIKQLTLEWCAVWRGESPRATGRANELEDVVGLSPYHMSQMKKAEALYKQSRSPYVRVA